METQQQSFSDPGFQALCKIAYHEAGLVLSEAKAPMIQSRLRHRLKTLQMSSLTDYCSFISSESGKAELSHMISALTTNVSGFFREPHHFELVRNHLLPNLLQKLKKGEQIRIWSAGCSNGQEPYSLAMFLAEYSSEFTSSNCKILATDIDHAVLRYASKGEYSESQVSGLSLERREKFFSATSNIKEKNYTINPNIRSMVTFRQLNLHETWPMHKQFDFIFCRNVVIYFDTETQDRLWPRFHKTLTPHGFLFVGHSERIGSSLFEVVGATTYAKKQQELTHIC